MGLIYSDLKDSKGMTLIEVMLVMVIIGIAVGIAVPNFKRTIAKVQLKQAATQLMTDIRYAQELAISEKRSRTVSFSLATNVVEPNRYHVLIDAFNIDKSVVLPKGIKLISCNFKNSRLTFGVAGYPSSPVGGSITLENQYNDKLYIIMAGATGRIRIDEEPPSNVFEKP